MAVRKKATTKSKLVPKDRIYLQKGKRSASFILRTFHDSKNPLQFKEEGKAPRSIRYCTNQDSIFSDEQEGDVILGRVVFIDGKLVVKSDDSLLQEMLSIYHPHKDVLYEEFDPVAQAEEEVDSIKIGHEAISVILEGSEETVKALGKALLSNNKGKSIAEIKHDLLIHAKSNPQLIIDLSKDEDLPLLSLASSAIEYGILSVSKDNTKIKQGDNIICSIPFNQDPVRVLTSFMKTKDGDVVKAYIKKTLK